MSIFKKNKQGGDEAVSETQNSAQNSVESTSYMNVDASGEDGAYGAGNTEETTGILKNSAETVAADEEKKAAKAEASSGNTQKAAADAADEQMTEGAVKYEGKGDKVVKGLLVALGVTVIGAYAYGVYHSRTHFAANTIINGYDVTDMTVSDVEKAIDQRIHESKITLAFREGQTETITGSDFDYGYAPDGQVQSILDGQNPFLWFTGLFNKTEYSITTPIDYSNEYLTLALEALPEMQYENMSAPVDAYVTYGEDSFIVREEDYGTQLHKQTFIADMIDYLDHSAGNSVTIDVESLYQAYEDPTIFQDNQKLHETADSLEELCGASITYNLPDGSKKTLDGNTLRTWLSTDENGSYYKDDEDWEANLEDYVAQLAKELDTSGQDRQFQSTLRGTVTVEGGTFGNVVDQSSEAQQLAGELSTHTVTSREPKFICREAEDGGIGNTYVEVDMANQHVFVYVDGRRVMDSDCVTGMMTSSRMTPEGTFYINNKSRNTQLVGADYVSYVSYWMSFYGSGYGLHDASWRGSFGGSIYYYGGSHGCVNLPYSFVSQLYEVAYVGMPVVTFYD